MGSGDETEYRIRVATTEDVDELVRMQIALQRSMAHLGTNVLHLNRGSTARLYEYYERQIEDELARLLVAQNQPSQAVVGMGAGQIWLHTDYVPDRSGELVDLWIEPDHRRRGLARRIVNDLLGFFRAHRVAFLAVNFVRTNPLGEGLWKGLGFEPVLTTATAARGAVEAALGEDGKRIVPVSNRSKAGNQQAYASVGLSG